MTVVASCDAQHNPPQGVRGGKAGPPAQTYKIDKDGTKEKLPGVVECHLDPGEWIRGIDAGGGGYGDPLERDPEMVEWDVLNEYVSLDGAREEYRVWIDPATGRVDPEKTRELRSGAPRA